MKGERYADILCLQRQNNRLARLPVATREPTMGTRRAGGVDGGWRDHCSGSGSACPPPEQHTRIIILHHDSWEAHVGR